MKHTKEYVMEVKKDIHELQALLTPFLYTTDRKVYDQISRDIEELKTLI